MTTLIIFPYVQQLNQSTSLVMLQAGFKRKLSFQKKNKTKFATSLRSSCTDGFLLPQVPSCSHEDLLLLQRHMCCTTRYIHHETSSPNFYIPFESCVWCYHSSAIKLATVDLDTSYIHHVLCTSGCVKHLPLICTYINFRGKYSALCLLAQ